MNNVSVISVVIETINDVSSQSLANQLQHDHPEVQIMWTKDLTYYSMKIAGIKAAEGDIVALLDSDCLPVSTWAERIVFVFRTAFENRHDLDIRVYDILYLLIVSPAVRTLEQESAILTLIKPNYFQEKFGW